VDPATDPAVPAVRRRRFGDNGALGMALFVLTEIMLFAGFVSAFSIVRDSAPVGAWPPAGQPRLPAERTAINTAALLLSGVALWLAGRAFTRGDRRAASRWTAGAVVLGAAFVALQGAEWRALLGQGLTLTSSQLGSFFYVIIGAHALHAIGAIVALALAWRRMVTGRLTPSRFGAVSLFWYFVVLVWPVIYWQVYR
jgi:heme/copper-type cytochrome/quinol oxidase subunit 3